MKSGIRDRADAKKDWTLSNQETAERRDGIDLGTRVRSLRQSRSLTLKELALRSGISTATLSKIENNLLSPTYENLVKLADGLAIDIEVLFSEGGEKGAVGRRSITPNGQGQVFDTRHYRYEMLNTDLIAKKMIPLKAVIKSRERRDFSGLISHAGEEILLVLRGEVELHTEFYAPFVLKAGDCAYFDSTMGHVCLLHGIEEAEVFWVCSSTYVLDFVARQA